MPSSVHDLMAAAGLGAPGQVRWGIRPNERGKGVYVVAATSDATARPVGKTSCPLSAASIERLLTVRPELRLNGERPSAQALAERVASFWLPDETILYVGLAGTSVAKRVNQYYSTRLGARSPHKGGWFLKLLKTLDTLSVHYVTCADPKGAERYMLDAFCANVDPGTRERLGDPARPLPFANLAWPGHGYKAHGIRGASAPRLSPAHSRTSPTRSRIEVRTTSEFGVGQTQRVTEADLAAGRVRIPIGSTKKLFPDERCDLQIVLRGVALDCRYDPRTGADRERSAVLSFRSASKDELRRLVEPNEVLHVSAKSGSSISLS